MRLFALGLLVAVFPSVASAQTSQCQWIGNVWTCNQQPKRSGVDWGAALNAGRQSVQPRATAPVPQTYERSEAVENQRRSRKLRETVGRLVADGKCNEARRAALAGGDFDLAKQAQSLCSP